MPFIFDCKNEILIKTAKICEWESHAFYFPQN